MDIDGNIIASEHYEYDGPIIACKGEVHVPPPSDDEIAIQRETLEMMRASRDLQDQFLPILLETSGYRYDDEGNLAKIPYDEYLESMDPVMRSQYENLQTIQEQTAKALKGELDVSPALEQQITDQKKQLDDNMSRRLGSNWQQSSAGIRANQEFNKSSESLREQARRGSIGQYSQLGYGGTSLMGLTPASQTGLAQGITSGSSSMVPMYQSALQPYQNERNMQMQAAQFNSQNSGSLIGDIAGLAGGALLGSMTGGIGTGIGASLGSAIGGALV